MPEEQKVKIPEKEGKLLEELQTKLQAFLGVPVYLEADVSKDGKELTIASLKTYPNSFGAFFLLERETKLKLEHMPNGHAPFTSEDYYVLRLSANSIPGVQAIAEVIPGTKAKAVTKGIEKIVNETIQKANLDLPIKRR